ncbi:hypothetical protein [Deinococcus sp. NW-56]|uniref:hypothetical protein n=1 Tax=Deinococcus sp. NW-56 TaxID=2080419 RepID=UPI000CF57856|nr:hypothetical protein [Deinococcus sp. NW-56]
MKKTPMTAQAKDLLIAQAAEHGITVERTSKDFFLLTSGERQRVTPGQIKGFIAQAEELARLEAEERAEALALADELRGQSVEEEAVVEEAEAESVTVEAPQAEPAPAAPVQAAKPSKIVVQWGPPCGGDLSAVAAATSPEGDNPIVHLSWTPATTYRNKQEAAEAGKRLGGGWLASLAQDADGKQFWIVVRVGRDPGQLVLDGEAVRLELLTGQEAEAYRGKVSGARFKSKAQWIAQAV